MAICEWFTGLYCGFFVLCVYISFYVTLSFGAYFSAYHSFCGISGKTVMFSQRSVSSVILYSETRPADV